LYFYHSFNQELIMLVSHNTFFHKLGGSDRLTLEASKPLHDAYAKATPEQQKDLFSRAVFNYTLGNMGFDETDAKGIKTVEGIIAKTRTARTKEQERIVNGASAKARYHLVSRGKPIAGKTTGKKIHFTVEQRHAVDNALASFEAETLAEQVKMLRAYLATLEV
jgi:hypothetical protein